MNQWAAPDAEVIDRVKVFVLTGYTGPTRIATLLSAEKWPTPADKRYRPGKPIGRWHASTVRRILDDLTFEAGTVLPPPVTLGLHAIRRVLRYFRRRGVLLPDEGELATWLTAMAVRLTQLSEQRIDKALGTMMQAQQTHLFDSLR